MARLALERADPGGGGRSSGSCCPPPGEVRYLKARPGRDARQAAKRITAPNTPTWPPAPIETAPEPVHRSSTDARRSTDPARDRSRRHGSGHRRSRRHRPGRRDPAHDRDRPGGLAVPATQRRPPTRARRRGPGRPPTRLVERRIGLLFAVFLLLLSLAALRATWLGTVKVGLALRPRREPADRGHRGPGAARHDLRPERRGAGRVRGLGHRLRAPVPDRRPGARSPARLAPLVGRDRGRAAPQALGPRDELRLPAPQDGRVARRGDREARNRGHRHGHRAEARLPAGLPGLAGARLRGHRQHRAVGARVLAGRHARRRGRRAPAREGRARRAGEPGRDRARQPGENLGLTLDARIQERTEAVLGEVGPDLHAAGRHRGRDGPAERRGARAGQLAARGREQRRRRARLRPPEPRGRRRTTSRARPSRRSRSRARSRRSSSSPETTLEVPPEIQVADRTVGEAHDGGGGIKTRRADPRASRRTSAR